MNFSAPTFASATSASLSLALNTTYYWQVRAISNGAITYANGGNWFFFSTQSGFFNKTAPRNWTYGVSATPTLTWDPSSSAVDYEYCVSAVNGTCSTSWVSTSGANSANPAGLALYNTYYWQVRAVSVSGAYTYTGGWWAFVTQPSAFNKTFPRNWSYGNSPSLTLTWDASLGATDYEYCVSAVSGSCSTSWISTSGATSANPAGLALNSTYYWQVRAVANGAYTYTSWWAFVTEPGAFNKTSPKNWTYGNLPTLTLTWGPSAGTAEYEYCVSAVSGSCSTSWVSTSGATSANPAGLADNTTYYWQVRAVSVSGAYKYAGSWWAFVTQPGLFNKSYPTNWSTGASLTPTLSWGVSTGASGYEYCISTTIAGCTTWIPVGNVTSILIGTPLLPSTTYYWQVRAVNGTTFTLASGTAWAFVTGP